MKISNKKKAASPKMNDDYFKKIWEESWTYIKTVVDIVREPVIILDTNLCVMAANGPFYTMFKVHPEDTENKNIFELGNGQWDIRPLRNLLEDIVTKGTYFKGFEVSHEFPTIGKKTMMLNARQIQTGNKEATKVYPSIIMLALEDITDMLSVAETVASHSKRVEAMFIERAKKLEMHIHKLEKDVNDLKKKSR